MDRKLRDHKALSARHQDAHNRAQHFSSAKRSQIGHANK